MVKFFRSRRDKRRWSRRLVDDETRAFVDDVLEETSEIFRTASGEFQLRGLCLDVFASAPTTDLRHLKETGVDAEQFYRRELAPNWEGLTREERARKIDQFIDLSHMLGQAEPSSQPSDQFLEIVATVHVKVLLLAWAHDRTYSYMDQLFNGPLQYRSHRYRLADGRV
ncbi:MAG: hypothetical protein QOI19_2445, partial [Thermoleophilaceae bacterium]|nr:hypothetical protein [Thermoleophilaceae bacterium]